MKCEAHSLTKIYAAHESFRNIDLNSQLTEECGRSSDVQLIRRATAHHRVLGGGALSVHVNPPVGGDSGQLVAV